jgi:hypothetical protein
MKIFDLGIAFVWEFDNEFIDLMEEELQAYGISTYRLQYFNLAENYDKIINRKLAFNFYLDRAWDVDADFEELGKILQRRKTTIFNPYKKVLHAIDKASMHLEFISNGIEVPYSIIIPPYDEKEEIYLSVDELAILGRPFIIKPCNTTGGGIGVVRGAETLKEVLESRVTNSEDKYILQEKIYPKLLDGKRAWFRCFWAFGRAIPVWWDDITHLYSEISYEETNYYNLRKLKIITKRIAKVTGLDFFSTEIVLTESNKFVVIDYVNDQCDMRLKSKHIDGVPDYIAIQIINNLAKTILKQKRS